jgi:hypothetical protein
MFSTKYYNKRIKVDEIELILKVGGLKMETQLQPEKLKGLNHLINLNIEGRTFKIYLKGLVQY